MDGTGVYGYYAAHNMDRQSTTEMAPEIVQANHARFEGRARSQFHSVESRMFLWSKAGRGTIAINGQYFDMQPFDYFVIPWRHTISYEPDRESPFHLAGIHLIPWHDPKSRFEWGVAHDVVDRLHSVSWRQDRTITGMEELLHFQLVQDHGLLQLSEYIIHHFARPHREREQLQRCAYALIDEVRYTARTRPIARSPEIQRLERFIERDIDQPLGVRDLARKIDRSPSHVTRLCRQYLHCTPGNWINDLKIRSACDQLRSTRLSIAEIAARTGYADQFYFSRLFKKKMGIPPLKYRQQQPLI
jgi:AraC-like DNA-binding protein